MFHNVVKKNYIIFGVLDEKFLYETPIYSKIWFIIVITSLTRFKYYFAWTLADAVCNASGFGFTGYNEKGEQEWNLLDNIDILGVEVCASIQIKIIYSSKSYEHIKLVSYY